MSCGILIFATGTPFSVSNVHLPCSLKFPDGFPPKVLTQYFDPSSNVDGRDAADNRNASLLAVTARLADVAACAALLDALVDDAAAVDSDA